LVWKQHGRDEEFQHEEDVEHPSQCFIDQISLPTYDTYTNAENLIEINFLLYDPDVKQK